MANTKKLTIRDEAGKIMDDFDNSKGTLEIVEKTVHHEAVEAVQEQCHMEEIAVHKRPDGTIKGRSVRPVIDVPGRKATPAYDEVVQEAVFHPHTKERLAEIEAEKNKPTLEQRVEELERLVAAMQQDIDGQKKTSGKGKA